MREPESARAKGRGASSAAKQTTPTRQVMVDVAPATSVIPADELPRVRVIKIDVEWQELEVLRSLTPVFSAAGSLAVFVELTPRRAAPNVFEDLLALSELHGFTIFVVQNGYSPERQIPNVLEEPTRLDAIPLKTTDLLLLR